MKNVRYLMACTLLLLAGSAYAGEPVDINTADAEALAAAIDGVGLKKARDIVADRQRNGPFASVEELTRVKGIGEQTVETSRENLTAGSGND